MMNLHHSYEAMIMPSLVRAVVFRLKAGFATDRAIFAEARHHGDAEQLLQYKFRIAGLE